MIAMRPVTIAGPDAQRHGRGNAGVAWLDLGLAMLIAQILYIELLPEWQRVGVHRADQFGTGPPRTSSFSSIGLIYRGRTIEPAACRAVMSGDEIDRCGLDGSAAFAAEAAQRRQSRVEIVRSTSCLIYGRRDILGSHQG
jgi:hypothetical protein